MTANQHLITEKAALYYATNAEHIADELKKLDLLLKISSCSSAGGSRRQKGGGDAANARQELENLGNIISEKTKRSMDAGVFLGFPALSKLFGLSPFEQDMMLTCLAPEVSEKYETDYRSLETNQGCHKPTKGFIISLLCSVEADPLEARPFFRPGSAVFSTGMLEECQCIQPKENHLSCTFFKMDQRILDFIQGIESMDARLTGVVELVTPTDDIDALIMDERAKSQLKNLITHEIAQNTGSSQRLAVNLCGPYGRGKKEAALSLCSILQCNLMLIDLSLFHEAGEEFEATMRIAFREGLLQAALYFYNFDHFTEERLGPFLRKIGLVNSEFGWLTFFGTEKPLQLDRFFRNTVTRTILLPPASLSLRQTAWNHSLTRSSVNFESHWPSRLAMHSDLSPFQVERAVASAELQASMDGNPAAVSLDDLKNAAREQYIHKLDTLSQKIVPANQWNDIVLPTKTKEQLREICTWVEQRHKVMQEWGYGNKFSYGNGVSALFHGPSGTGKTMAATALAGRAQLDLYRVDLSQLVSKYIGETEKNLKTIFDEAAKCHAILFFDEADALFAKRTDISDAHDRYANMETSFLLQKIEEYDGVAILSSNLKRNIDQAFLRRLKFLVEFPFPDKASRLDIWKSNSPEEAPLAADVNFDFLAEKFSLSGGNIKNILLNGAFLAAGAGGEIKMEHLLAATKREYEKIGKTWAGEFPAR